MYMSKRTCLFISTSGGSFFVVKVVSNCIATASITNYVASVEITTITCNRKNLWKIISDVSWQYKSRWYEVV